MALHHGLRAAAGNTSGPTVYNYTTGSIPSWLQQRTRYSSYTGFDANGFWINGNAWGSNYSYPIATNNVAFTGTYLDLKFVAVKNNSCSDHGFCIFKTGTSPVWKWGMDSSRIAFQWNCSSPFWYPPTGSSIQNSGASNIDTYFVHITLNLLYGGYSTDIRTGSFTGTQVTNVTATSSDMKLSNLNGWSSGDTYEIGFDADQDTTSFKSYFKDITITVS